MSRITFIAFIMLSGFFYITGKPVDKAELQINEAAGVALPGLATGQTVRTAHISHQNEKNAQTSAPSLAPVLIRAIAPVKNSEPQDTSEPQNTGEGLQVPSRNPRRQNFASSRIVTAAMMAHKNPAPKNRTDIALLKKPVKNLTFEDVKSRSTSAAVKPLMVSYQKRYVKEKNPVLGPRLTAILLKRELRRVGCYEGAITSSWNDNARSAVENFNVNSNSNLTVKTPTAIALEQVQQTTRIVCAKKAPVVVAGVPGVLATTLAAKKASQWTTKLQRSNGSARRLTFSGESADQFQNSTEPAARNYIRRIKKPRVRRRNYRAIAKRVRKTRYTRRTARRRTAIRSWKRTYRRKRFGFRRSGMEFSIGN